MSVPPQIIRVKRKATEDPPVSFLRLQESKRHRSDDFVYRRQEERPKFADNIPPELRKPIIHTSKSPIHNSASKIDKALVILTTTHIDTDTKNKVGKDAVEPTAPAGGTPTKPTRSVGAGVASEPRRFHMSRINNTLHKISPHLSPSDGRISKKRSVPTLFVERKVKRVSSKLINKTQPITNTATTLASATMAPDAIIVDAPEPRKYKKPGVAKHQKKKADDQQYKAELPKLTTSQRSPAEMEKLAVELDQFTIAQIGLNIQKIEDEKSRESAAADGQAKFMPSPTKRFAKRQPKASVDEVMTDADVVYDDSDDGDYITETYERVPASKMEKHVLPQDVGILVMEDSDEEGFYGTDHDDSDGLPDDEEDENAENYYGADYPEDPDDNDERRKDAASRRASSESERAKNRQHDDDYDDDDDDEDDDEGDDEGDDDDNDDGGNKVHNKVHKNDDDMDIDDEYEPDEAAFRPKGEKVGRFIVRIGSGKSN
ncbi:hypothetical protein GGR54DRAFT_591582 [Hypoxylon sp. NC1633]|nr:hypothetical protein GGR54DRAFT_591582 [Hypoxylon sp. NC1633]